METYSLLTVLGLLLTIFLWFLKRNSDKQKAKDALNKKIDDASDASDIMRISGELRK